MTEVWNQVKRGSLLQKQIPRPNLKMRHATNSSEYANQQKIETEAAELLLWHFTDAFFYIVSGLWEATVRAHYDEYGRMLKLVSHYQPLTTTSSVNGFTSQKTYAFQSSAAGADVKKSEMALTVVFP